MDAPHAALGLPFSLLEERLKMKPTRFQVLVGRLVCLSLVAILFTWPIEPSLAGVMNASR
jgi:hypothetical protein